MAAATSTKSPNPSPLGEGRVGVPAWVKLTAYADPSDSRVRGALSLLPPLSPVARQGRGEGPPRDDSSGNRPGWKGGEGHGLGAVFTPKRAPQPPSPLPSPAWAGEGVLGTLAPFRGRGQGEGAHARILLFTRTGGHTR